MIRAFILLFVLLLPLGGCGFQSLYGDKPRLTADAGVRDALAATQIGNIPNYDGLRLRQTLREELYQGNSNVSSRYTLTLEIRDNLRPFGIRPDDTFSYGKVRLWADYALRDTITGAILTRNTARATQGYVVASSQYASLSAEEDARWKAQQQLASTIARQLAVFF